MKAIKAHYQTSHKGGTIDGLLYSISFEFFETYSCVLINFEVTLPREALGILERNKKNSGSWLILKRKSSSVSAVV